MDPIKPLEHLALATPRESAKGYLSLHIGPYTQPVPHLLFTPLHYEPGYAYPLVVWLHGPGTDEGQLGRVMPKISLRNYVSIGVRGLQTPKSKSFRTLADAAKPRYDWPQEPEGIAEATQRVFRAIEFACAKRHIHPGRIFLAGSRSGGTMAFRIAFSEPSYFAGVISLGGPVPKGGALLRNFSKLGHLRVLLAVTRNCPYYPNCLVCEDLRFLHRAGPFEIMLREYPAGWHLSLSMLRDVDRWLMEQITQESPPSAK